MANPVLIVIGRDQTRRAVPLGRVRATIGRGADNLVSLPEDEKLSRHHCVVFRRDDGTYAVEDLKSLNGTRVNGRPLKRRTALTLGDTVRIGHTTLIFEAEDSPMLETQALQVAGDAEDEAGSPNDVEVAETEVPGRSTALGGTPLPFEAFDPHQTIAAHRDPGIDSLSARAQRLSEENQALRTIIELAKGINDDLALDKVLTKIVDAAIEFVGAERGVLILDERDDPSIPPEAADIKIAVARNRDGDRLSAPKEKISLTLVQRVLTGSEALLSANAQHDGTLSEARSIQNLDIKSVLGVGLRAAGRVLGALYLDHRWQEDAFASADLELIEAFADLAARALANAQVLDQLTTVTGELRQEKQRVDALNTELGERFEQQTAELRAVRATLRDSKITSAERELSARYPEILGEAPVLLDVLKIIDKVITNDLPVYIQGEPGTGKELVARAIHVGSSRRGRPFIAENCAALTETLLESELFGHVRGAFTGADRDHEGLFERADGGTIFLDEIGEMSPGLQAKLLRVLEEGEVRRVGDKAPRKIDIRLITATNRDLEAMVEKGTFREDLLYRVNVFKIVVPPLRERREDIPLLFEHMLTSTCVAQDVPIPKVDTAVLKALMNFDWPGNVRQLQNEVRRMVALSRDETRLTREHISDTVLAQSGAKLPRIDELGRTTLKAMVEDLERRMIVVALKAHHGNKSQASQALGLSRLGLRKKMERYGIETPTS